LLVGGINITSGLMVGQTGTNVGEEVTGDIVSVTEGMNVNVETDVGVTGSDETGEQLAVSITNKVMVIKYFLKFKL